MSDYRDYEFVLPCRSAGFSVDQFSHIGSCPLPNAMVGSFFLCAVRDNPHLW